VLCHKIDAHEWRAWGNPEIYVNKFGLRLDEIETTVRDVVLEVMRASMSPKGYKKARDVMYVNHFLGELVHAPRILNQFSYNFNLFGTPSLSEPWGWNLYGHHLALNCLVLGEQMVLSPAFLGAEPNEVDEGPKAGLKLFQDGTDALTTQRTSRSGAHLRRHGGSGNAAGTIALRGRGARVVGAVFKEQLEEVESAGIPAIPLTDGAALGPSIRDYFPKGADVIFDTTGAWVSAAVSGMANHGRIATTAAPPSGHIDFPLHPMFVGAGSLVGVNSMLCNWQEVAMILGRVAEALGSGKLAAPRVRGEYPIEAAINAYHAVNQGAGKSVILFP